MDALNRSRDYGNVSAIPILKRGKSQSSHNRNRHNRALLHSSNPVHNNSNNASKHRRLRRKQSLKINSLRRALLRSSNNLNRNNSSRNRARIHRRDLKQWWEQSIAKRPPR